jgi:hypothetical protein
MKFKKSCLVAIIVLLGCEGTSEENNAVDANVFEQSTMLNCVVYLNPEAEKKGLGTSWYDSIATIDDAIQVAEERLKEVDSCEIWTKELGKKEEYERLVSKFDGRITIKEKSFNSKSTYNNYEKNTTTPSSAVGKTTTSSNSIEINNAVIEEAHTATELLTTGTSLGYSENEADYTPFGTICGCDKFSTRIEISPNVDATGSINTGSLEIASKLRIDGNEIITNTGQPLSLQHDNNGDLRVDNTTFVVDASTNRVGIGNENPSYTLDVNGDIKLPGARLHGWESSPPVYQGLDIYAGNLDFITTGLSIKSPSGYSVVYVEPGYRLVKVNGSLKAEELILEADLADYVFQDGYDLQNLEEVEAYIKANKHLPNMPSETDVDAHGLSVADFNNLLLQKIEELTLHMIDQAKQIKNQRVEIDELKAMLYLSIAANQKTSVTK